MNSSAGPRQGESEPRKKRRRCNSELEESKWEAKATFEDLRTDIALQSLQDVFKPDGCQAKRSRLYEAAFTDNLGVLPDPELFDVGAFLDRVENTVGIKAKLYSELDTASSKPEVEAALQDALKARAEFEKWFDAIKFKTRRFREVANPKIPVLKVRQYYSGEHTTWEVWKEDQIVDAYDESQEDKVARLKEEFRKAKKQRGEE